MVKLISKNNERTVTEICITDGTTGEIKIVKAYGDVRICAYPECNNILNSRKKKYCSRKCSCLDRNSKKRGVKMTTENNETKKIRMLVCNDCGFELPDTRLLEFNAHQTDELHEGFSSYKTDKIPEESETE